MIIEKYQIGARCKKTIYTISSTPAENGESRPREIARFDALDDAALALRYMTGCTMSEADETAAKEAIKKAAAPTVESKGNRKATA